MIRWLEIGLTIFAWFLERSNASDQTKRKFLELVESTKDDGLITVKTHDTFKEQYKNVMGVDVG